MKYKVQIVLAICLLWTMSLIYAKPDNNALVGKIGDRE